MGNQREIVVVREGPFGLGVDFTKASFPDSSCGTANCQDWNGTFQYLLYDPDTQSWVGFGAGFAIQITRVGPNWVMRGYDGALDGTQCWEFTQSVNGGLRPTIGPWDYASGCGSVLVVIVLAVWNPPNPVPGAVPCDAGVSCCDTMNITVSEMTATVGFCGGCLCNTFNGTYAVQKNGNQWTGTSDLGKFALLQCFDEVWYLSIQCPVGLTCATYSTANVSDCVPDGAAWTPVSGLCTESNIDPNPITVTVEDDSSCLPVNPCSPDPEMLVTVTGGAGTINWVGETWNLPADSGVQKSVCPTSYTNGQTSTIQGAYKSITAEHQWVYGGGTGLILARVFFGGVLVANSLTNCSNNSFINKIFNYAVGFGQGNDTVRRLTSNAGTPCPQVTNGGIFQSYFFLGFITANNPPAPTWSSYSIPNSFFGNHTVSGINYAWAKGLGW
jgi:hypothetical protein